MAAEYDLLWQTSTGQTLGNLDKIIECQYGRTESDAGEMTLILPDHYYDEGWFQPYSRVLVMRTLPGVPPYVDLETPWFIIDGPYFHQDEAGREVVEFGCTDALGLILRSRNIAYNDNNEFTLKLDEADDMLKTVVKENAGSLATDTDRDLSGFMNVAPNSTAAPIILYGSFARQPMLDVLKGICDASAEDDTPTWLGFDVVLSDAISGLLEFRTYVGQRGNDHRFPEGVPPIVLSVETGALVDVRVGTSYRDSASFIYAGGAGLGDIRPIITAQDDTIIALSPFARQERFVDGSQILAVDALEAFAKSNLREARPRRSIEARLVETAHTLRGIHWDYGDYLTAEHRNLTYDVRVEKIGVKLSPGENGGLIDETQAYLRGDEIV